MRKSYLFTVLLILLFIGTLVMTNNAWAVPMNCQDYQCTGTYSQYGVVISTYDTCVELCTGGDPYNLYGLWFFGYLYPIDSKNFLGTASSVDGWAGCSVERKGRTITVQLTYMQQDNGYIDIIRCTPCNDCCEPG